MEQNLSADCPHIASVVSSITCTTKSGTKYFANRFPYSFLHKTTVNTTNRFIDHCESVRIYSGAIHELHDAVRLIKPIGSSIQGPGLKGKGKEKSGANAMKRVAASCLKAGILSGEKFIALAQTGSEQRNY